MKEVIVSTSFSETPHGIRSDIFIRDPIRGDKSVFYEFGGEFLPKRPPTNDFAVVATLLYAMQAGVNVRYEGRVSRAQMECLEEAQEAWSLWFPNVFRRIKIIAEEEVTVDIAKGRDAVLAYSGGLDATFAMHAHKNGLLGRRTDDIRGAVMVQGFDVQLHQDEAFAWAFERGKRIADNYGVPLTTVRTNILESGVAQPWRQSFIAAISSVVHQYAGTTSRAIVSTDESYDGEVLGWGSNSITNRLYGNYGFPIDFTGGGCSRTNKAKLVANSDIIVSNLRVCFRGPSDGSGGNCGTCEKCIRTKLNFLVCGSKSMPTLGGRPTAAEIDAMRVKNPAVISFYRDILQNGDWTGIEDLRSAVLRLIGEDRLGRHWVEFLKLPQRLGRSIKKRFAGCGSAENVQVLK